jgi:di/tricarboxylate transporter
LGRLEPANRAAPQERQLTWEAWFTLAVVVLTIILLARDFTAPSAIVFGAVVALLVAGVLEPHEAFGGFGNPAPITVAALYVVAAGIERTGILNRIVDLVLGSGGGDRRTLTRLLIPTAAASAFLNNTPIVAMMVPPVSRWTQRMGRSVSRFLMPLSYAAMLGGMVTLIGTSTNVVVSGLLESVGMDPMGFFEISKIGLPVAIGGVALLVLVAPITLPDRRPARRDIEDVREFVVEMTVDTGGPLDGLSVAAADLRHLAGVFLAQVERAGETIAPVSPSTVLRGGDRLRFVGNAREVADVHDRAGLTPEAQEHAVAIPTGQHAFFEAVIGDASPLVGASLKGIGFRQRYQAAVLAIHRAGQRVEGKLGEVRLKTGDTLLVLASPAFQDRWHGSNDFLLVSRFGGPEPARSQKIVPASIVGLAVVAAAGSGLMPILEASLLGAIAMVVFGVLSPNEARTAVDLDVIVVIAAAFGLGEAIGITGLAQRIADGLVAPAESLGPAALVLAVSLATLALTEAITNNAAAVLMFPVAVAAANDAGADPRAFAIVVALMASASFLTPIGYQTNTMVWGPGGYRFGDYARLGTPLTIYALAVVAVLAPVFWVI